MSVRILQGDARDRLKELPDESVHCCVCSPPYFGLRAYLPDGHPDKAKEIGLEPTPAAYVAELVSVFRDVRRVMRSDSTCWLNLGDSFSNKQLLGIPWRVAFALQDDGWILRSDIVWAKKNCMPESVTDRPTRAHEYIFFLTKSARYFYDAAAIAEAASESTNERDRYKRSGYAKETSDEKINYLNPNSGEFRDCDGTRNKRSVWTVATQPFPGSHFAVFPPALIEPCILAGCPAKCCAKCGAPWVRDTVKGDPVQQHWAPGTQEKIDTAQGRHGASSVFNTGYTRPNITRGFIPSCDCAWEYTADQGTVLDPFGGAGTTALVADRHQRNAILIELNPDYVAMSRKRVDGDAPLFAEAAE